MPGRALGSLTALLALTLVIAGCGPAIPIAAPSASRDPLAGSYIARGGGGALDNVSPLIKAFTKLHPSVTWQGLDDIGSDAGVKLVQSGDIDMSFISRELKTAEVGTVATLSIGATGTGIAVLATNPVGGVTKDELGKIFHGDITDWRQIGGVAGPIRVLLREPGAATRTALEAYCFGGKPTGYAKNAIEVASYDETVKAMHSLTGPVGMMSMSAQAFAEPTIKFLAIDGIAATRKTLADGTYTMRRPLYLVYPVDPSRVQPAVRAFIDFVKSPDGQAVLNSL
jgi:phosphate transport system substrate-binding protein